MNDHPKCDTLSHLPDSEMYHRPTDGDDAGDQSKCITDQLAVIHLPDSEPSEIVGQANKHRYCKGDRHHDHHDD